MFYCRHVWNSTVLKDNMRIYYTKHNFVDKNFVGPKFLHLRIYWHGVGGWVDEMQNKAEAQPAWLQLGLKTEAEAQPFWLQQAAGAELIRPLGEASKTNKKRGIFS